MSRDPLFLVIPNLGNPVTAVNAARLKAGMTYEQVLKLLASLLHQTVTKKIKPCSAERGVLVAKRSQGL